MDWPKITAETPIDEIQRIHKDIWQYVVENGDKPRTPYFGNCVACEYSLACVLKNRGDYDTKCVFCPIDWGELGDCGAYHGIYALWIKLHDNARDAFTISKYTIVDAGRIAVIIRDIPFKTNERSSNNETANENP